MIQRFINDLKKLISGRDVKFPAGVIDASYGSDSPDIINLTVFGEPVEIVDGDLGELTTLCYSKGRQIRELYEIIDSDFALWVCHHCTNVISIEWYIDNWRIDYDGGLLNICGISLDGVEGTLSDLDLFWYIIEKLDVEILEICRVLCSIYDSGIVLAHCGFGIEKVSNGYRVHADPSSYIKASVIFDGDGIIVKDAKEMELMKEMYSL